MFKTFAVRTHHDNGIVTINVPASDKEAARRIVMAAEKCPERSILSVRVVRPYPSKTVLMDRLRPNSVECFRVGAKEAADARAAEREHGGRPDLDEGDAPTKTGWYYWTCLPGCLPDSTAFGPYASPLACLRAAYDNDFLPDETEEPDYGPAAHYMVIVGNVGTVLNGNYTDGFARSEYSQWCAQAKEAHGRASGEAVTLLKNDEIVEEQASTNESE